MAQKCKYYIDIHKRECALRKICKFHVLNVFELHRVLFTYEEGIAQSVEHWTANLAAWVQFPGCTVRPHVCTFLHVQMEINWAGLSVCNCWHTGKWCGTIKAVWNTDHKRRTWIHMQTPLSPLAGCGPVGEGTSGKVLNWTVRLLNHAYTTQLFTCCHCWCAQGRRKHFQIEGHQNGKPQIESRSRNLITKWKYKLAPPPPLAKTKNVLWAYILQKPHKVLSVKAWLKLQYDKRLNIMDHMRISSTEPSLVILSQTK